MCFFAGGLKFVEQGFDSSESYKILYQEWPIQLNLNRY